MNSQQDHRNNTVRCYLKHLKCIVLQLKVVNVFAHYLLKVLKRYRLTV